MPADIQIMAERDIPEAIDLWKRTPGVGLNESDSPLRLAQYLVRNPHQSFVARDGKTGKLIGAVLGGNDGRRGYLQHLAVDAEHRRRGIGTALIGRCLSALTALGIYKCNVFVFATNADGQAFWRGQGWQSRDDLLTLQILTGADA